MPSFSEAYTSLQKEFSGKVCRLMKAFVVDDEALACKQLQLMLQNTGAFDEIQTFQDPEQALSEAAKDPIDAAFLDIEMPEINGIELAEALQRTSDSIHIVFTTAYNEYAVKAFELNAVDYLLKPIMKGRLDEAVRRLLKDWETKRVEQQQEPRQFGIECFGSLKFYQIINERKDYLPVKWRTNKAREVYAYLLSAHDHYVSKDMLMEHFWSNSDPEKVSTQLYTTIYQIRKMMEQMPFHHHIVKNDLGYSINLEETPIDCEEWEQELRHLPEINPTTYQRHLQNLMNYQGHYLGEYDYPWAELERIRLAQLWLNQGYALIRFLMGEQRYVEAIDICHRIERIEPEDDRNMKYLLQLYNKTGNVSGAIRVYAKYRQYSR